MGWHLYLLRRCHLRSKGSIHYYLHSYHLLEAGQRMLRTHWHIITLLIEYYHVYHERETTTAMAGVNSNGNHYCRVRSHLWTPKEVTHHLHHQLIFMGVGRA